MNALQIAIDAISLGAIYALAALGIGLIVSIMRLINFAHGELIMAGGFCLYSLAGQPLLLMAVAAMLVCAVAALGVEQLAFRPLRKAKPGTLLISFFAVPYLLRHVALMMFGSRPVGMDFMGLRVPKLQIAAVIITAVLLTALALFFKYSRMSVQMRAAAENFTMARLVGVRANRVIAWLSQCRGCLPASCQCTWWRKLVTCRTKWVSAYYWWLLSRLSSAGLVRWWARQSAGFWWVCFHLSCRVFSRLTCGPTVMPSSSWHSLPSLSGGRRD